jgi:hypothetical protein
MARQERLPAEVRHLHHQVAVRLVRHLDHLLKDLRRRLQKKIFQHHLATNMMMKTISETAL